MGATGYDVDHWSQREATDEGLEQYLRDNRTPYNAAKTFLLEQLLGAVGGVSLLDYGGGAGYFGLRQARRGAQVTLVDPAQQALSLASHLAGVWSVRDQLETQQSSTIPDFGDRRFDVIVLKDVIEHVHDDAGLLRRCAALQKPGGTLLISTHNSWSLYNLIQGGYHRWWLRERNWLGWDPTHVRFYSPRSLGKAMLAAGYVPEQWASVYIVPYNIASWFFLLKRDVQWPWLSWVDRLMGRSFPLNHLGWNILVRARRAG